MMKWIKGFAADESGQGMTEYGLIIAIVAVFLITALIAFRGNLSAVFTGLNFNQ